jgi:hypothetical protein
VTAWASAISTSSISTFADRLRRNTYAQVFRSRRRSLTADPARKRSDGSSPALTAPRVVAGALGVVVISFAVLVLVLLWQRQGQAAYVMPVAVPVAAILCVALTISGAVLATYRSQAIAPWLTLLTTLLFGAALVALLSIGVFILVVGVLCLLVRLRVRGTPGGRSGRLFVGAGLLLSLGLAPLSVLAIQGPIVSCTSNGVSTGTPVWTDFGGGGSGSSSTGEGSSNSNQTNGTVMVHDTTYSYSCASGKLVSFSASHESA